MAAVAPPSRPEPVLPDYGGACIDAVSPALLGRPSGGGGGGGRGGRSRPEWLPEVAWGARQVVLLALDGLGWDQLCERRHLAPTLASMAGGAITSVAPTTTATALTSLTTGRPPAVHGVMGYRIAVGDGHVLNVLRWRTATGDARASVPPAAFQRVAPFEGTGPPVVTRAEFGPSGFTRAHLGGVRLTGWRMPSTLVVEVRSLVAAGEPFVYAYYDGVDKVAHEFGFGEHYDAEVAAADRLVADLRSVLPAGAALVVTADHGQVQVGNALLTVDTGVLDGVGLLSGEGRFRWLHAAPGVAPDDLAAAARAAHGDVAWVHTRAELEEAGWFGGPLDDEVAARVGDVALVPFRPVAFLDPADTGETVLVCRHGSLTREEVLVPLLAGGGAHGQG